RLGPDPVTLEWWNELFSSGKPLDTIEQLRASDKHLFEIHERRLDQALHTILRAMPAKGRVVIVTHNPLAPMLLALLMREQRSVYESQPMDTLFPKGGAQVVIQRPTGSASTLVLAPPT